MTGEPTRLLLWRHGTTDWNVQGRVQGHTDVPLSADGRAQAVRAAPLLAGYRPAAIVTSDLRRCTETAAVLAGLTDVPVRADPRLRERGFGEWEGLTRVELTERFPASYARWRSGDPEPGHGLEPVGQVVKRMGEALREAAGPEQTTVVVTHGGSARFGIADLLGWPPEVLGTVQGLDNCHASELLLDPARGWVMRSYNVGPIGDPPGYEE